MKILSLIFSPFVLLLILVSCDTKVDVDKSLPEEIPGAIAYDSAMAVKLGADQYGMKSYVLAFLKIGPNRNQDSMRTAQLMRKHLDNINRMADEGKLVVAGPFLDDGDIRGIYIFNVTSVEEARALTETDPAIKEGRLVMELHPWYGSAALMTVNELHKKIEKQKI